MPEDNQVSNPKPPAVAPFKVPTGTGEGFDPETEKPWGVDPATDKLSAVTPSGLMTYYGLTPEEADALYCKVAGVNHGAVFFNPANESPSYRPPINIVNPDLAPEVRAKIDKILSQLKGVA
jgi:hypothetical protein